MKAVLLVVLPLLIYGFGIGREFVFDDILYIGGNPMLRRDDAFRVFWLSSEAFNYYPLFWSLLRVQWLLWGDHTAGYHLVNLLLHCFNALLVWQIGRAWKLPGAWWAALLFAVHPVNVQTVAWAAEQKNTWSFLFMALAVLMFIRHLRDGRWQSYAGSLLCFFAALACKTSPVALPVFLALAYSLREPARRIWPRLLPFFLLSLGAGLTTIWFEKHRVGAESLIGALSLWQRLEASGAALWFYAAKALLPIHLTPMYAGWVDATAAAHTAIPGLLLAALLVVGAMKWRRIGAPVVLGIAWYVLLMAPLLGVFDTTYFIYSHIADHWQYHALPGLLLAATSVVGLIVKSQPRFLLGAKWAGGVLVTGFALLASAHFAHFEDARALWTYVTARNPDAWVAWYNLGSREAEERQYPEAIEAYRQSLRLRPDYYNARFNLASALAAAGRLEEADRAYLEARAILRDDPAALVNHAVVLLQLGRDPEAIEEFKHALELDPAKVSAQMNLLTIFIRRGQMDQAEPHLSAAVVADPTHCRRIADALTLSWREGRAPTETLIQFATRACALSGNQPPLLEALQAVSASRPGAK